MTEKRYGKYVIQEPIVQDSIGEAMKARSKDLRVNCDITYRCIRKPVCLEKEPHVHDFHQLLGFIGGNPMNLHEFGAEAELLLGEEGEKHIIDKTTIVSVPPGLPHCPLNFKRVDRPVLFMSLPFTGEYKRI